MDKRGQFFIVGAIILALVLFILMTVVNTYREENLLEDFPSLTNNYKTESVKVINNELLNSQPPNPQERLDTFTENFVSYARTIDPKIGLIYVYRDKDGNAYVRNYLLLPASVYQKDGTDPLFPVNENTLNEVSLDMNGFQFKKTIPVRISNYDDSYSEGDYSGDILMEIGGIFYPMESDINTFEYVARSEGGQIGVDIS